MAFYTSSIKTQYVEPQIFFDKNRAEFRLGSGSLYLANWRLLRVGNTTTDDDGVYYAGNGVLQYVKSIELLDGGKTISKVNDIDQIYTFMRFNKSNEYNLSMCYLDKTDLGFLYTATSVENNNSQPTITQPYNLINPINGQYSEAFLDLNAILPFLSNTQIVPTTIFKDLRLVLTFKTSMRRDDNFLWGGANPPLLAVDEMMNEKVAQQLVSNYKGFTWTEIENDRFIVPAVDQASLADEQVVNQSVSAQIKGFDNKMCRRFVIQKKGSIDNQYSDVGSSASVTQWREVLQVRKNGQNIFAGSGLDSPARIQSEVVDVWGEMNKPDVVPRHPEMRQEIQGASNYMAFDLTGARVNELQIQYQRANYKDLPAPTIADKSTQQLTMNIYGEVFKTLVVNGDGYRITYL